LRLAGEEEARAVQNRMLMTMPERIDRPAWMDMDTPLNEQIVRYGSGPSASIGYYDKPAWAGSGQYPIGKNPTDEELNTLWEAAYGLPNEDALRAIEYGKDVYLWPADLALHGDAVNALGLKNVPKDSAGIMYLE